MIKTSAIAIISSIFMLGVIYSCQPKSDIQESFILTGKILNSEIDQDHNIKFTYSIFGNDYTQYIVVDENNEFKIESPLRHAIDCKLNYNKRIIRLYCAPSTNLYLEIDTKAFPDQLNFKGDNAEFNRHFIALQRQSRTYLQKYLRSIDSIQKKDPEDFKEYVIAAKSGNENFLKEFSYKTKCDRHFYNWALNYMNYELSYDLFFNEAKKDSSYYDFFSAFDINNKAALSVSTYWNYLQNYFVYLLHIKNKIDPENITLIDLGNIISDQTNGHGQDFLLAYLFINSLDMSFFPIEDLKQDSLKYFALINSRQIKLYLESKFEDYLAVESSVTNNTKAHYNISGLNQVFTKYSGNYVYVKVWADWCGPCIKSMPDFKALANDYKNKGIEFVLVAINSDTKRVENILSHHNISCDAYILDEGESEELKNELKFKVIPHYFILDRNGEILINNAENPKSPNLRKNEPFYSDKSL